MLDSAQSATAKLQGYNVQNNQNSVSGLSSGAFMAVQLHLACDGLFCCDNWYLFAIVIVIVVLNEVACLAVYLVWP